MLPSSNPESPPSSPTDFTDDSLQPFFVLHRAPPRKVESKSNVSSRKTSRKIVLSPCSTSKCPEKQGAAEKCEETGDGRYEKLQLEAFDIVWSTIESNVKDVLRNINVNVFNDIQCWVRESFEAIRACGIPSGLKATVPYPICKDDVISRQLFAGLVLTKNVEFVDDLLTFEELGVYLKSHGSHVASLSSLDFSSKNGISGCFKSLLRQFLMINVDVADISILASWYSEQETSHIPVIVIIDNIDRCCGPVLSDFILVMSEWAVKIPIILIMGVATTLDALRNILPSNALQNLCPCTFSLGSPAERMNAIVEAVLVKQCSGFIVGYKVAAFMRNYFLRQDGTITSFIRSLKIACAQHFSLEPLSFLLQGFLCEEDIQGFMCERQDLLAELVTKKKMVDHTVEKLSPGLSELKRWQRCWTSAVLCLSETGKYGKIPILDLLCEVLDPDLHTSKATDDKPGVEHLQVICSSRELRARQYSCWPKGGFICQAFCTLRDLPVKLLFRLLKSWENLTEEIPEFHDKVKELLIMLISVDGKIPNQDPNDKTLSHPFQNSSSIGTVKDSKGMNEKAAVMLECMVRNLMQPIESMPFHDVICYKSVDTLRMALIGDPRRRIQLDLLESQKILRCSCCCGSGSSLLPSMHDTSIMYHLAQEHGDLINLHDWYQSFRATILGSSTKKKQKVKQSPSKKKRKTVNESEDVDESSVQNYESIVNYCQRIHYGNVRVSSTARSSRSQQHPFWAP